jgi:hypothetical protein
VALEAVSKSALALLRTRFFFGFETGSREFHVNRHGLGSPGPAGGRGPASGLLLIVKVALATSLGGFPLTTAIALTVVVLSTVSRPRQNPMQRPRKGCRTVAEWITSAR